MLAPTYTNKPEVELRRPYSVINPNALNIFVHHFLHRLIIAFHMVIAAGLIESMHKRIPRATFAKYISSSLSIAFTLLPRILQLH
jgi:hypothetical protein